jgi:hypothetical protein
LISTSANLLIAIYETYKAKIDLIISGPLAIGELGTGFWLLLKGGMIRKH